MVYTKLPLFLKELEGTVELGAIKNVDETFASRQFYKMKNKTYSK